MIDGSEGSGSVGGVCVWNLDIRGGFRVGPPVLGTLSTFGSGGILPL